MRRVLYSCLVLLGASFLTVGCASSADPLAGQPGQERAAPRERAPTLSSDVVAPTETETSAHAPTTAASDSSEQIAAEMHKAAGIQAYEQRNYREAFDHLEQARGRGLMDAETLRYYAQSAERLFLTDRALTAYQEAVAANPDDLELREALEMIQRWGAYLLFEGDLNGDQIPERFVAYDGDPSKPLYAGMPDSRASLFVTNLWGAKGVEVRFEDLGLSTPAVHVRVWRDGLDEDGLYVYDSGHLRSLAVVRQPFQLEVQHGIASISAPYGARVELVLDNGIFLVNSVEHYPAKPEEVAAIVLAALSNFQEKLVLEGFAVTDLRYPLGLSLTQYRLGVPEIQGAKAIVPVTVTDAEQGASYQVYVHLASLEGKWKVTEVACADPQSC